MTLETSDVDASTKLLKKVEKFVEKPEFQPDSV